MTLAEMKEALRNPSEEMQKTWREQGKLTPIYRGRGVEVEYRTDQVMGLIPKPIRGQRLLTTEEAVELSGLNEFTLRGWARAGVLDVFKYERSFYLFGDVQVRQAARLPADLGRRASLEVIAETLNMEVDDARALVVAARALVTSVRTTRARDVTNVDVMKLRRYLVRQPLPKQD